MQTYLQCLTVWYLLTGSVDVGCLSHPVLIHLRSFFDLWESFTLQALQDGQPFISDHITFEVGATRMNTHTYTMLHSSSLSFAIAVLFYTCFS